MLSLLLKSPLPGPLFSQSQLEIVSCLTLKSMWGGGLVCKFVLGMIPNDLSKHQIVLFSLPFSDLVGAPLQYFVVQQC
jgi:hypothetical protein